MDVRPGRVPLASLLDYVENMCRPLTADKGLDFTVDVDDRVPATLHTDQHRLQQILRNLLSNAVKFTEAGEVRLDRRDGRPRAVPHPGLRRGPAVVAFQVIDTGIGIPADKLKIIFEAFQQADGTTSRRYGGTGLGLSISRSIAHLLGGEIHAESSSGAGSPSRSTCPPGGGAGRRPAAGGVPGRGGDGKHRHGRRTESAARRRGADRQAGADRRRRRPQRLRPGQRPGAERAGVSYADNGDSALAALSEPPPWTRC